MRYTRLRRAIESGTLIGTHGTPFHGNTEKIEEVQKKRKKNEGITRNSDLGPIRNGSGIPSGRNPGNEAALSEHHLSPGLSDGDELSVSRKHSKDVRKLTTNANFKTLISRPTVNESRRFDLTQQAKSVIATDFSCPLCIGLPNVQPLGDRGIMICHEGLKYSHAGRCNDTTVDMPGLVETPKDLLGDAAVSNKPSSSKVKFHSKDWVQDKWTQAIRIPKPGE